MTRAFRGSVVEPANTITCWPSSVSRFTNGMIQSSPTSPAAVLRSDERRLDSLDLRVVDVAEVAVRLKDAFVERNWPIRADEQDAPSQRSRPLASPITADNRTT